MWFYADDSKFKKKKSKAWFFWEKIKWIKSVKEIVYFWYHLPSTLWNPSIAVLKSPSLLLCSAMILSIVDTSGWSYVLWILVNISIGYKERVKLMNLIKWVILYRGYKFQRKKSKAWFS